MLDLILTVLVSAFIFFLISRVCIFFANRNVDPFPDLSKIENHEERSLEEERQRRTIQGMHQMQESMKKRIF